MDRRQKKTREAIFSAFTELLSKKNYEHITVGEIIELADVGRTTFYSHFETKDFLLKEMCAELFCHIFDTMEKNCGHHHIFDCESSDSVFLHLFRHIQKNDNNILELLASKNNEIFLRYFKNNLVDLVKTQMTLSENKNNASLPDSFVTNHIASTFVETVRWWIENGKTESPETMNEYFLSVVSCISK